MAEKPAAKRRAKTKIPANNKMVLNAREIPKRPQDPKPIHWVDNFEVSIRAEENLAMLVGYAINPQAAETTERYEVFRLMITASHAASLADALAKVTNHYPEKPSSNADS